MGHILDLEYISLLEILWMCPPTGEAGLSCVCVLQLNHTESYSFSSMPCEHLSTDGPLSFCHGVLLPTTSYFSYISDYISEFLHI